MFKKLGKYLYKKDFSIVTVYKNMDSKYGEYAYRRKNDSWRIWLSEEKFNNDFIQL